MTILITRPLDAAKRTEQALQAASFETWIDPVLTIMPIHVTITPNTYDAIITTSGNGVESFATLTQDRDTPIFCAGSASAATARELGFISVFHPVEPGGRELISLIKQSPFKHLAYLRGEVVKIDIAQGLRDMTDVRVDTYITYKTVPTAAWTHETITLFENGKITAITFYSEYSARVTLDLLRAHGLLDYTPSITALCLSDTIAEVIRDMRWKNIETESLAK
ncbi:MAG: uroporphyrinogen-III synthase [Pseudomonadota bacterium]